MKFSRTIACVMVICGICTNPPKDEMDGHFSSWKDVPKIIDSIDASNSKPQLEQLHRLTRIKLGYPQSSVCLSEQDHQLYMLQTKRNWKEWWESTGKPVSELKTLGAEVDQEAFQKALKFLGTKPPSTAVPVWIPDTWTLYVTYSNGDYSREDEIWIVDRQATSAKLFKLRVESGISVSQSNSLMEFDALSPLQADRLLKALCYLHRYAPVPGQDVANDVMPGTYYPHSTLRLRDGENRVLWNTEGYDFSKTRPEFGDGESGRSYYFLNTVFSPTNEKWKSVIKPTSQQLALYRRFLKFNKPYFSSSASHVVRLFAEHGGNLERNAIFEWAEKQKSATNPKMDWKVCSHEFGTGAVVNVLGFTRLSLQQTMKELQEMDVRLEAEQSGSDGDMFKSKQKDLEEYVANMLVLEKQEKADAIQAFPQPLRDLVQIRRRTDDSNLKHLSAAIQAIRKKPDPELFKQLVQELHEGTLEMRSLLEHILLNEHDFLDIEPWGAGEEAIAVGACIDSLHLAKLDSRDDLLRIILHVCGGGTISIVGPHGRTSITLTFLENGYQFSTGSDSTPLSLENAKKRLRQLYEQARSHGSR